MAYQHGLIDGSENVRTGTNDQTKSDRKPSVRLIVLGNAQDAGFPQANCQKKCCREIWNQPEKHRYATCIAVIDEQSNKRILFECTPNFPLQIRNLQTADGAKKPHVRGANPVDAIFLTHAHIGHYGGLIHLGREVIGSRNLPVYVMPRMRRFLIGSGPWSQLVELKNIELRQLTPDEPSKIGQISVTPILVPHRDEFSETVGFRIQGPNRSALFLPDIDKWEKWKRKIETEISKVDYAFLDGTFFDANELPGRNMAEIPHPFMVESIKRFGALSPQARKKIFFIHFNHSNPVLNPDSGERKQTRDAGFRVARQGAEFKI